MRVRVQFKTKDIRAEVNVSAVVIVALIFSVKSTLVRLVSLFEFIASAPIFQLTRFLSFSHILFVYACVCARAWPSTTFLPQFSISTDIFRNTQFNCEWRQIQRQERKSAKESRLCAKEIVNLWMNVERGRASYGRKIREREQCVCDQQQQRSRGVHKWFQ